MASSEMYSDGSKITRFFKGNDVVLAEKLGNAAKKAFEAGAVKVEQHIIMGNEVCPKCDSGIRFDLCCGKTDY